MPFQFGFVCAFYREAIGLSHKTLGAPARRLNKQSADVAEEAPWNLTARLQSHPPSHRFPISQEVFFKRLKSSRNCNIFTEQATF